MNELKIKGYLRTSLIEWPGKISAVIFLPNCNFRCSYCYNKDLVLNPKKLETIPVDFVFQDLKDRKKFIDGVAITGGEPTLSKGLKAFVKKLKKKGFSVMVETNGTRPEVVGDFIEEKLVDFWSMDVKAPLNLGDYGRVTGVKCTTRTIGNIRESIRLIKETEDYEFKTTVVPALLTKKDIIEIARFLGPVKSFYLQQFQPKNCLDSQFEKKKPYSRQQLVSILQEVKKYTPSAKIRGEDEKI